jgi:hypothetical protein
MTLISDLDGSQRIECRRTMVSNNGIVHMPEGN